MSTQAVARERQPRHLQPDPALSLDELATIANRGHALCTGALRQGLEHAITAGDALTKARAIVETGHWGEWLKENFRGGAATARRYMRCAEHRERLTPDMTTQDAMLVLVGAPSARAIGYPDERRAAAITLVRDKGVSIKDAAETVGASGSTVHRWVNPEKVATWRRETRTRDRKAREALAAQEREREIKRAVRKAGDALAEAYSMSARMAQVLAQARSEADDLDAMNALQEATAHYHKMSDAIVRALGVSS